MPKRKFKADYNHRWPSGAETAFKRGFEGTLKQEVVDAATKAGALYAKGEGVTIESEPTLPGNLDPALGTPDALTPNLSNAANSE